MTLWSSRTTGRPSSRPTSLTSHRPAPTTMWPSPPTSRRRGPKSCPIRMPSGWNFAFFLRVWHALTFSLRNTQTGIGILVQVVIRVEAEDSFLICRAFFSRKCHLRSNNVSVSPMLPLCVCEASVFFPWLPSDCKQRSLGKPSSVLPSRPDVKDPYVCVCACVR